MRRNAVLPAFLALLLACLLASLFYAATHQAPTPPARHVACIRYDPQDEAPGLDWDSHNCRGVS